MFLLVKKKTLLDKSLEISLWKLVERTEKHWQVESMETLKQRDRHQLGKNILILGIFSISLEIFCISFTMIFLFICISYRLDYKLIFVSVVIMLS